MSVVLGGEEVTDLTDLSTIGLSVNFLPIGSKTGLKVALVLSRSYLGSIASLKLPRSGVVVSLILPFNRALRNDSLFGFRKSSYPKILTCAAATRNISAQIKK